jgi:hypothetical protein
MRVANSSARSARVHLIDVFVRMREHVVALDFIRKGRYQTFANSDSLGGVAFGARRLQFDQQPIAARQPILMIPGHLPVFLGGCEISNHHCGGGQFRVRCGERRIDRPGFFEKGARVGDADVSPRFGAFGVEPVRFE